MATIPTMYKGDEGEGVIDFSERRLVECIICSDDVSERWMWRAVLKAYIEGRIKLSWSHGVPVPMPTGVTRKLRDRRKVGTSVD